MSNKEMNLRARGMAVTPCGSQTRSKSPSIFPILAEPYVQSARGATITLADGTELIDLLCGMGASILGYGEYNPASVAARRQIEHGIVFGLPHRLEVEVSECFTESLIASPESVRWVKTGSEACSAAMRIARRATQRNVIVTSHSSYHGWHDGYTASKELHPGVPEVMTGLIDTFKYNDLEDLDRVLAKHSGDVAAVMMEPALFEKPEGFFLNNVREVAHRQGALFVLDEMVLGARLAWSGGQEAFGVKADLACYGKAIAGGWPLACVVGSKDLLGLADVVSGTFGGDAAALAACNAAIALYSDPSILRRLHENGKDIQRSMEVGIYGLPAKIVGLDPVWKIVWNGWRADKMKALWCQELIRRGVLAHPDVTYSSVALGEWDLKNIRIACQQAGETCRIAFKADDWSGVQGLAVQPVKLRS